MPDRRLPADPVGRRRHARMALEVFAEERLVGKIQVIGDLLNAHGGIFEQCLGLDDHVVVDPLRNRQPADPFYERREVFGRDAELSGIEPHAAFGAVVFAQQVRELLEIFFGMLRGVVVEDVPDLVDRRGNQPVDDIVREMGFFAPGFTLDLRDETAYRVAFLVRERQAGVGCELQEKLEQVFCVDVDAAQEIG